MVGAKKWSMDKSDLRYIAVFYSMQKTGRMVRDGNFHQNLHLLCKDEPLPKLFYTPEPKMIICYQVTKSLYISKIDHACTPPDAEFMELCRKCVEIFLGERDA